MEDRNQSKLIVWTILTGTILLYVMCKFSNAPLRHSLCNKVFWDVGNYEFEDFDNDTGLELNIVPNILHFIRYGRKLESINFMDAVNILAAYKNLEPDAIFFHTDLSNFTGSYWEALLKEPGFKNCYRIVPIEIFDSIFGQKLHSWWGWWHLSDLLRIQVLREYGGIFVDNDVFIVRKMEKLRKFEMVLGIIDEYKFGTMTLIAHKDARFLKLWYDSYRDYRGHMWYYNAGEKPKMEILDRRPELIHNENELLGVQDLRPELYVRNWSGWRDFYSIHTMIRHLHDHDELIHNTVNLKYPVTFDENNILLYNVTIKEMVVDCCSSLLSNLRDM